ncbi:LysR substrate-binding domain-containing protein [Amphibiibacter pelophylacis]|uniref:LysR substrate-binding domain-containing protein n=1 Tax=Amphibiibacter pelophylacis TaxID=1799477 RepID=A0ACC6P4R4_9BURK
MRNGIPALGLLQAFEAAARLGNFSRAGDELALTASAISRHVAALEDRLGTALFVRHRRRVTLTDTGHHYAQRVRLHLSGLAHDTRAIANDRQGGYALSLAVVPSFATQWLIPRLPALAARRPDIQVHLSVRSDPFDLDGSDFDAVICAGTALWPGTTGQRIASDGDCLALCAPDLARQHDLSTEAAWHGLTHIHLHSRPSAWADWYALQGWNCPLPVQRGPRYELFSMVIAAVTAGLGVGLLPQTLAQNALDQGQLVRASDRTLPGTQSYWLARSAQRIPSEALLAFEDWVVGESGG